MKLYHGSSVVVRKPLIARGRKTTDFGKGFYTTTDFEQAARWARIKRERLGYGKAVVSVYDFDERFYNSAHPDMIYTGFLSGDENISLEGFFKFEQVVKTKLPGIRPVLILKTKHNTSHMFLPVADTMVIDLSRQEIYLTWRLTIPDFFGMKEGVLSCIIPECIGKKYYG